MLQMLCVSASVALATDCVHLLVDCSNDNQRLSYFWFAVFYFRADCESLTQDIVVNCTQLKTVTSHFMLFY